MVPLATKILFSFSSRSFDCLLGNISRSFSPAAVTSALLWRTCDFSCRHVSPWPRAFQYEKLFPWIHSCFDTRIVCLAAKCLYRLSTQWCRQIQAYSLSMFSKKKKRSLRGELFMLLLDIYSRNTFLCCSKQWYPAERWCGQTQKPCVAVKRCCTCTAVIRRVSQIHRTLSGN